MRPEQQLFVTIRNELVEAHPQVETGNMMGSPAITKNGKVFAFLSKKFLMVFKLGKEFDPENQDFEIRPFNPFKKKGPLTGWYEVPFSEKQLWKSLTNEALEFNS
ncbi:MAG: hypothetical protein JJ971_14860 [Balneolaceae bacterium]|nr:hypothetical protein [Balneolaceae bacterium]MBO6547679.1 hypothetical protein [Balneolaceae bacterium]MBO6648190.1 hypothetical protein [Balneolaceae bacterium]